MKGAFNSRRKPKEKTLKTQIEPRTDLWPTGLGDEGENTKGPGASHLRDHEIWKPLSRYRILPNRRQSQLTCGPTLFLCKTNAVLSHVGHVKICLIGLSFKEQAAGHLSRQPAAAFSGETPSLPPRAPTREVLGQTDPRCDLLPADETGTFKYAGMQRYRGRRGDAPIHRCPPHPPATPGVQETRAIDPSLSFRI